MTFPRWLRTAFGPQGRVSSRRKSGQPSRRAPSFRLMLGALEDRTVPSGTPGAPDPFLLTPVPDGTPLAMHIHPHLTILVDGQDQVIPAGIGIEADGDLPVHTHDDSGTIHIESPVARDFTLQDFFTTWGQPFNSGDVLGHPVDAAHPLAMTVDGQPSTALGTLVLHDGDDIVIRYGRAPAAAVHTNQKSYARGATVAIDGTGFAPGEVVDLRIAHIDGTENTAADEPTGTTVADASGAISTAWLASDLVFAGSRYELTAIGEGSHQAAFATFRGVPGPAATAPTATLTTDRHDYAPGTTAVISGAGFTAGETVAVQVVHVDGRADTDASHAPWTVVADSSGAIRTTWRVDATDAIGSTLAVRAVGQSSRTLATALLTDSTNPPTPRPFWVIAHNPDSEFITQQYLERGVNGLEPDIEYFSAAKISAVNTARAVLFLPPLAAQPGYYIAHGNFNGVEVALGSRYDEPVLTLVDYLTWLDTYLKANQTQLSLIAFDVKTAAAEGPDAIATILSDIANNLLKDHPEIHSIINVGSQADAASLFTSKADTLFAALPTINGLTYKQAIGFSIDGEDDVTATSAKLRALLGTDIAVGFGDGSAGCCNSVIDFFGLNGFLAPNTPGALARAAFERTAFGDLNMDVYGYSIHGTGSMHMLIDQGVDGLIPADNADPTSNLGLAGVTSSLSTFGDTDDALAVVNAHYDNIYLATTADNPFTIPQPPGTVATGRNGYALEVKTSDVLGGGTDANITFTLKGDKGSASITLDTSWSQMMERDDTNYVFLPSADLGKLQSVTVFNDGSGGTWGISLNSEWNVDYIKVRSYAYIGTSPDDFYYADYGGQDVGDPIRIDLGPLGTIVLDKGDQNPSTRPLTASLPYLTATAGATATGGVEGVTSATLVDAKFHDRNTANTDFSITAVDWGDGSTSATGLTISGSNGAFTVNGTHLYTEEGNYGFSITVQANGSGPDAGKTATIYGEVDVGDPAVTLTAGSLVATEGTLSTSQTLATFTDPGGPEPLTDYSADVDWGDGNFVSNDAGVTISGPVAGVFTVTGRHLYADEDFVTGPVRVKLHHDTSTTSPVVNVPLTLTDPPVRATAAAGPFLATEGTMSPSQTLATFNDPGGPETPSDYTADVDWGNGTFVPGGANVTISGPVAGVFTVTGRHLYLEEDGFPGPVRVRVNHEGAAPSPVVTVPLTLTDPPVVATGTPLTVVRGSGPTLAVATFTDPGGAEPNLFDPGPIGSHYAATIRWGDGTPDVPAAITYNGTPLDDSHTNTFTVAGRHDYTTNGTYTITVTIHHEGAVDTRVTDQVKVVSLLNHAPGPCDNNSLLIGAALTGSTILVVPVGPQTGGLTDTVRVLINGVPQVNTDTGGTTFTGFNTITIYGQAGSDNLEVAGGVKKNASFFGSGGNDRLKGGGGNNLLVGNRGNDLIIGGAGTDVIIGGGGYDQLVGGGGGDFFVAGFTDFDDPGNPATAGMLCTIRAAWANPNASFNTRSAAVLALLSTNGTNAAHVHYNTTLVLGLGNTLILGGPGQDAVIGGAAALIDPFLDRRLP